MENNLYSLDAKFNAFLKEDESEKLISLYNDLHKNDEVCASFLMTFNEFKKDYANYVNFKKSDIEPQYMIIIHPDKEIERYLFKPLFVGFYARLINSGEKDSIDIYSSTEGHGFLSYSHLNKIKEWTYHNTNWPLIGNEIVNPCCVLFFDSNEKPFIISMKNILTELDTFKPKLALMGDVITISSKAESNVQINLSFMDASLCKNKHNVKILFESAIGLENFKFHVEKTNIPDLQFTQFALQNKTTTNDSITITWYFYSLNKSASLTLSSQSTEAYRRVVLIF